MGSISALVLVQVGTSKCFYKLVKLRGEKKNILKK